MGMPTDPCMPAPLIVGDRPTGMAREGGRAAVTGAMALSDVVGCAARATSAVASRTEWVRGAAGATVVASDAGFSPERRGGSASPWRGTAPTCVRAGVGPSHGTFGGIICLGGRISGALPSYWTSGHGSRARMGCPCRLGLRSADHGQTGATRISTDARRRLRHAMFVYRLAAIECCAGPRRFTKALATADQRSVILSAPRYPTTGVSSQSFSSRMRARISARLGPRDCVVGPRDERWLRAARPACPAIQISTTPSRGEGR